MSEEREKKKFNENDYPGWVEETEDIEESEDGEELEPYGMMSRIIGVFIEPGKAFRHIGTKPEILGAVLFCVFTFLISSLFTMSGMTELTINSVSEQLAETGMTPEQLEMSLNVTAWMIRLSFITSTLSVILIWLIVGLVAYIVGLFMGQEASYKSSLAVVAYSMLPAVLIKQGIIATLVFMTGSWETLVAYQAAVMKSTLSLYALFGNSSLSNTVNALLISVDPFMVWGLILMAIGFRYANKVRADQGWKTAIAVQIILIIASIPLVSMSLSKMSEGG
ncbi:YIP1 family protein [bacterium]|nr:YIP1 family protein [bacterium]MBU1024782.1 YIP1 family protein [bacterium]